MTLETGRRRGESLGPIRTSRVSETATSEPGRKFKRSWVKLDRFAITQLARDHRLTVHEQHILQTLTMHAEFRTAEWLGSATELAEYTRMSRSTATRAVKRLVALGLLEEIEPFGPHQQGVLRVLWYDLLVTDALSALREVLTQAREHAPDSRPIRAEIATDSRPIRAEIATDSRPIRADVRESPAKTDAREVERWRGGDVVLEAQTLREAADEREVDESNVRAQILGEREGSDDSERDAGSVASKDDGAMCAQPGCSESIADHTYSDHEPVTREASNEGSNWLDVSDLSDEEIGLSPCDREELDRLFAEENSPEKVGTIEDVAVAMVLRVFPEAELIRA